MCPSTSVTESNESGGRRARTPAHQGPRRLATRRRHLTWSPEEMRSSWRARRRVWPTVATSLCPFASPTLASRHILRRLRCSACAAALSRVCARNISSSIPSSSSSIRRWPEPSFRRPREEPDGRGQSRDGSTDASRHPGTGQSQVLPAASGRDGPACRRQPVSGGSTRCMQHGRHGERERAEHPERDEHVPQAKRRRARGRKRG